MSSEKTLYVVHCIDTEGPLNETLEATFKRLKSIFGIELEPTQKNLNDIQNCRLDFNGKEVSIAKCFSPDLLRYNRNWVEIDLMLSEALSKTFREKQLDDYGGGWVYSWHCMDHVGLSENPRNKDIGYGNIFNHYSSILKNSESDQDEINWHFHPLSLTRNPLHAATSYENNFDLLHQILCRRIINHNWFPVVNRPGFHAERPDSHLFLEQWFPFDYANQCGTNLTNQPDLSFGRFGDWERAPETWRGYHPDHDDYQREGSCRRRIFRCLNVGTRFRGLTEQHVRAAFAEADECGSAILAFADHDYRDIRKDVDEVRKLLGVVKEEYPSVKIRYAGAETAAVELLGYQSKPRLELTLRLDSDRIYVEVVSGEIFGPQPYLAIKTRTGQYFHDNLDVIEHRKLWTYVFDEQTIQRVNVSLVGLGCAGRYGGYCVQVIKVVPF
jgi:hypothetical protein